MSITLKIAVVACAILCGLAHGEATTPQVALPEIPATTISITDFGGVGDGITLNGAAFEKAIGSLAERGGGKLLIPPGIWLTGPIALKSKVELHLETGALIRFSGDCSLYPLVVVNIRGEQDIDSTSPISGQDLEDVAITGKGSIDGGGDAWRPVKKMKLTERDWQALVKSGGALNEKGDTWWPSLKAMEGEKAVAALQKQQSLSVNDYLPYHQYLRPKMLRLIGCKRVLIQDVTIHNPPNWTINPALCEDVSILNVSVRNSHAAQNSDALDLESVRRAVVRGCFFDTGDDGICIKSGKDEVGRRIGVPTEDILIEDCVVFEAHGGFTIGSEMSGGVRNVRVNNCTFIGTDVGLRFKSTRGRGGIVEDIHISNIRMVDIGGDAINFNLYYGGKAPLEEDGVTPKLDIPAVTEATPQFRNIRIEKLICVGAQGAIVLQGLPEMPIRNIDFKDVFITANKGITLIDAEGIQFQSVRVAAKLGDSIQTTRVSKSSVELLK